MLRQFYLQPQKEEGMLHRHITTPIFYPNASPHLGHLYSSLLADVQHRWNELSNPSNPSYNKFTTGTDEHGLKIQQAAGKVKLEPRQFVDTLVPRFKDLDRVYDINYTKFIRTTEPSHIRNVEKLWDKIQERGYIYPGSHSGWYSVSDETFYPESKVIKVTEDKYINTETNNEVTYHKETNYFFALSRFQEKLEELLSRPGFVWPESKRIQLLRDLNKGNLADLSVSRPANRLSWAVPVPNDPTQSVYVWFDALMNYISALGPMEEMNSNPWWSQTTHIIGKDIMKFHCWYWPSFLWAADLPLPKRVIVHDHWLSQGTKMSKSLGNVVDPMKISSQFGTDIVRWSLLENSQLDQDNNFQTDQVIACRNMFVDKWGNLIQRCCNKNNPERFNLQRSVQVTAKDINNPEDLLLLWKDIMSPDHDIGLVKKVLDKLNDFQSCLDERIQSFQYNHILKDVWNIIDQLNIIIQTFKPWDKTLSTPQRDLIIYLAMDITRILCISTQPIIPNLSNRFLDRLDIQSEKRSLLDAEFGIDHNYGARANTSSMSLPIERKVASYEYKS